ncbi:MAG TPA: gamma-glutamyl-gamma-aminobutyrate hydrolase family protein, partial [Bacillota bacterium]|nr:gamma-glutamyl-gamma-aminobutyrate hydrolase family protein [Bacillota bacterium]
AEPGSKLAELFGGSLNTNSFHHQCIDRLAPVLKATARSADGVVEAVELPGAEVMGVQWHPEFDVPETREKLFAAFFSVCAKYGEQ